MHQQHALLLIDLQIDFLDAQGRLPISQLQVPALLQSANTASQRAASMAWPIVAIGNEFSLWDLAANLVRRFASLKGSAGSHWDPRAPQSRDAYFAKQKSSAFTNPALDRWLQAHHVGHLHLAGVKAGACVRATAKAALRRGYRVYLIEQAIGDDSDRARSSALKALRKLGCEPSDLAAKTPNPVDSVPHPQTSMLQDTAR